MAEGSSVRLSEEAGDLSLFQIKNVCGVHPGCYSIHHASSDVLDRSSYSKIKLYKFLLHLYRQLFSFKISSFARRWPIRFFFKHRRVIYLRVNQLDAQNFCFTISLFHTSTCFEHVCPSPGGQNCIYTASGIITPIGGRLVSLNLCTRRPPICVMIPEAV